MQNMKPLQYRFFKAFYSLSFSKFRVHLLILIFFLALGSLKMNAQDQIILKSGEMAFGKVIDITKTEVVYVVEKEPETELFMLDKSTVRTIIYEDGKVETISGSSIRAEQVNLPYKNAIKLEVASLFFNNFSLIYERSLVNRVGVEIGVGTIGVGAIQFNKPRQFMDVYTLPNAMGEPEEYGRITTSSREKGYFFRIGPKFSFSQKNSLIGWYAKPELVYSSIRANGSHFFAEPGREDLDRDYEWQFTGTSVGILARVGVQVVRKNRFIFDMNLGFGFSKETDEFTVEGEYVESELPSRYRGEGRPPFRYSHVLVEGRAYMIGIAIGVLL